MTGKRKRTSSPPSETTSIVSTDSKPGKRRKFDQNDVKCEHCGKIYARARYKQSHVEKQHNRAKVLLNYRCYIDNQRFETLEQLNKHFYEAHNNDTKYHVTESCFRKHYQVMSKSHNANIDPLENQDNYMKVLCSQENFDEIEEVLSRHRALKSHNFKISLIVTGKNFQSICQKYVK